MASRSRLRRELGRNVGREVDCAGFQRNIQGGFAACAGISVIGIARIIPVFFLPADRLDRRNRPRLLHAACFQATDNACFRGRCLGKGCGARTGILTGGDEQGWFCLAAVIQAEFERTTHIVRAIKGENELMQVEPILQRVIRLRNPYVDPLNFIQVEMLRRLRALDDPDSAGAQDMREVIILTINGIAAGLRNTG